MPFSYFCYFSPLPLLLCHSVFTEPPPEAEVPLAISVSYIRGINEFYMDKIRYECIISL